MEVMQIAACTALYNSSDICTQQHNTYYAVVATLHTVTVTIIVTTFTSTDGKIYEINSDSSMSTQLWGNIYTGTAVMVTFTHTNNITNSSDSSILHTATITFAPQQWQHLHNTHNSIIFT